MNKPLVAGNWKLNGSRASIRELVGAIRSGLGQAGSAEVMVCPPYVYLAEVVAALEGAAVFVAAQDVAAQDSGAYTGEVSAAMLRDVGCTHSLVGHSERRTLFGDTDDQVAAKFVAAQAAGLTPVLCIGETLEEREAGRTETVVATQLGAVMERAGVDALEGAILAYEPVWAIGTGRTATPEQAQEVHARLRSLVADADARIAADLRILYGGSVKADNAAALFSMPDIDGGLIGGASLDAESFLEICRAASLNVR